MNFKEIVELIDKVASSGIALLEVEQAGTKVRIEGKAQPTHVMHAIDAQVSRPALPSAASPAPALAQPAPPVEEDSGLHVITSPIVGTFYRSPNPESESFVNVGDRIAKGKVLCIVEAMKLMNEIESDVDGVLVKIYPQNGQPIEYGEKLFAVRT